MYTFKEKLSEITLGQSIEISGPAGKAPGTVTQINKDAVLVASVKSAKGEPSLPGGHPVFAFPAPAEEPKK